MKIEVEIEDGVIPEGYEVVRAGKAKKSETYIDGSATNKVNVASYDHGIFVSLIVRKKIPSYQERQDAWIKEHGIKAGSKVRVTCAAESHEDGWNDGWSYPMGRSVGKVYKVTNIAGQGYGIRLNNEYNYPYFVLEPVKGPEYVPYTFETMPVEGIKCRRKNCDYGSVAEPANPGLARFRASGAHISYDDLFNDFVQIDGTPCGVKVEE